MEYREEWVKGYILLDVEAKLPVYEPGVYNPETVLTGRMKHLRDSEDMKYEGVAVSVPAMYGRGEPKNLIERCVAIYRSEGYGLDDIESFLRIAADNLHVEHMEFGNFPDDVRI